MTTSAVNPRAKFPKNVERTEVIYQLSEVRPGRPTGIPVSPTVCRWSVVVLRLVDACSESWMRFTEQRPDPLSSENRVEDRCEVSFQHQDENLYRTTYALIIVASAFVATRKSVDTLYLQVKGQLYQETQDQKISLFEAKSSTRQRRNACKPESTGLTFDGNFQATLV
ncbi:MAG: hypothetical protein IPJ64_14045 [Saprospiraceae bacterium]|nr:hypothetical protein [Saprospiraceae bacterium]